jgi:hypothetical protein
MLEIFVSFWRENKPLVLWKHSLEELLLHCDLSSTKVPLVLCDNKEQVNSRAQLSKPYENYLDYVNQSVVLIQKSFSRVSRLQLILGLASSSLLARMYS